MSRDTLEYTHGDTGTKPSSSLNFDKNERPQAGNFDWFWYNVTESFEGHAEEFDRLDSNDDGVVDETDTVTAGGNLKGDLDAVDGETIWNESGSYIPQERLQNDSVTVQPGTGMDSGGTAALGGSLTVDVDTTTIATRTWVDGNADVPNADYADNAGDADTVDGWDKADIKSWVDLNADVPDADYADDADTVDGWHKTDIQTWVDNNADVPDADYADDADTVDGWHKSDIQTWVDNNADVPNADHADSADDADTVDGRNVHTGTTAPDNPESGDIWIDTS